MSFARNIGEKLGKATTQRISRKEAEGMWQKLTGLKLTGTGKSIIAGATGVGIAIEGVSAMTSANHVAKDGTVMADDLANMVNSFRSPGIAGTVDLIDKNTNNYDRFVKENMSKTQSGIDPNVVFALHELRNG